LYFQTGAKEPIELLASAGEPIIPAFAFHLKGFDVKAPTVPEQFKVRYEYILSTFRA
jgi:hypothetical protein